MLILLETIKIKGGLPEHISCDFEQAIWASGGVVINHRQIFTFFKISKNTERILFVACLGSSKIFLKKF
jgi:hypothetical protein